MDTQVFVTGVGTGVGKTFVSAVLVAGLGAKYWKPVQAGSEPETDRETVQRLTGLGDDFFIPEYACLAHPLSPHAAAKLENIELDIHQIHLPVRNVALITEGAGGILVPLNSESVYADLLSLWNIPSVIVSRNYLGSINHTLMTAEIMQTRNLPVKGIIFTGESNLESESVIESYSGLKILGKLPWCENPDKNWIHTAFRKYISW